MPVEAISKSGHPGLNQFQKHLRGTWMNQDFGKSGKGGMENPCSYNVMPLPQGNSYILKNFSLFETVQFDDKDMVAVPATAPNRAPDGLQAPTALFYSQNVSFAEGPGIGKTVHVENGAWLNLETAEKLVGPYLPPDKSIDLTVPNQQPPGLTIAKQMSVPHGNSILALGHFDEPVAGKPTIPKSTSTLPIPVGTAPSIDTTLYTKLLNQKDNYQNPSPKLTLNPNLALVDAVKLIAPNKYIHWGVSTGNSGMTMNIPYEKRAANVTAYTADYWLLSTDGGDTYNYLAYTQNISMQFMINGKPYTFPHVTTNCVTRGD